MIQLTGQSLQWDAWNRLIELSEGAAWKARYTYDGLFRRISKETPDEE